MSNVPDPDPPYACKGGCSGCLVQRLLHCMSRSALASSHCGCCLQEQAALREELCCLTAKLHAVGQAHHQAEEEAQQEHLQVTQVQSHPHTTLGLVTTLS